MNKKLSMVILLMVCNALWSAVNLQINTKNITQGEPFVLIITDDGYAQVAPDLSPLEKDFYISGTEHSASVAVINNTIQSKTRWMIQLIAKKSGALRIPSLEIRGIKTKSIAITVAPSGQSNQPPSLSNSAAKAQPYSSTKDISIDTDKDVLLTAEVSSNKPYLNQQVIYTMRLLNARRLVDVEFTPPSVKNALMFPLGDGQRYETTKKGKRYAVEEQRYAVFPLKSGEIRIQAPTFSALIYDGFPQRVRPTAAALSLQVQPVPKGSSVATWLPASMVEVEENYSSTALTLSLNETLIREVSIKALGITSELIPESHFSSPDGVKLYSDQPERKNYLQNNEVLGTSSIKLTYLFNQPGEVCLPSYTLTWFNTKTKKEENATLPKHCLTIKSSAKRVPPKYAPPNPKLMKEIEAIGNKYLHKPHTHVWLIIAYSCAALIILGLLLIAIFYTRSYRKRATLTPSVREIEQALKKACENNNATQARDHFLQWIKLRFPNAQARNLQDAAKLTAHQSLMGQVKRLSDALYATEKKPWSGKDFWEAFKQYRTKKNTRPKNGRSLPPINPY